jgi:hypothetical protein
MPSMPKKVYGFTPQKQNKQAEQKNWLEGQGTRKVLQFKGVAAPIFIL